MPEQKILGLGAGGNEALEDTTGKMVNRRNKIRSIALLIGDLVATVLAFLCAYAFREAFQEVYQKEAWMVFKAILITSFLLGFGVFTLKFQFVSRIFILFFLRLSSDPLLPAGLPESHPLFGPLQREVPVYFDGGDGRPRPETGPRDREASGPRVMGYGVSLNRGKSLSPPGSTDSRCWDRLRISVACWEEK